MEVDMLNNNSVAVSPSGDYSSVSKTKTETAQQVKGNQQSQASQGKSVTDFQAEARYDKNEYGGVQVKSDADVESKASVEILDKAIAEANRKIRGFNQQLQYSVHEKTKQIMIKVINSDTNEVVRELPPEKTLDAIAKMWELAGLLIDEKR